MVTYTNSSPYRIKFSTLSITTPKRLNVILRHRKCSISPERKSNGVLSVKCLCKQPDEHISFCSENNNYYELLFSPAVSLNVCPVHPPIDKWQNYTLGRSSKILLSFLGIPPINLVFCYGTLCSFHQNMPTGLCSNWEQVYWGRCIGLHFWSAPTGVKLPHISC